MVSVLYEGYKSWFLQIMRLRLRFREAETRSTPEAARLRAACSVDEWKYEMSMSEGRRGRPCMSVPDSATGDR